MPLARYFMYVGGVLLALLFVVDAFLPGPPVADENGAVSELPVIRIHSDRKWPERVVFDTSQPIVAPAQTAQIAKTEAAAPATVADVSAGAHLDEAFAQLQPSDLKQLEQPEPKKPEAKPQHKRRIAKVRVGPPTMLVAQQPRFGFGLFDNGPWHSTW
jgi:hypothetical protein